MSSVPDEKRAAISNIKIPDLVGGDPDLLLGVYYANCHPEVLHTLESGLFIARLKLASTNGYTGVIGGPHSSFAQLANYHGETVRLLSSFVTSIKDYKRFGPPSIPNMPCFEFQGDEQDGDITVHVPGLSDTCISSCISNGSIIEVPDHSTGRKPDVGVSDLLDSDDDEEEAIHDDHLLDSDDDIPMPRTSMEIMLDLDSPPL